MLRLSAALWASANAMSDDVSLMQGLKPVAQRADKSKQIANLMSSATSLLKNGATPDVVDFAQATLSEIMAGVLPAIISAHTSDQALVDNTFDMFEAALVELEEGTARVKVAHDEERRHSAAHKACRDQEEVDCRNKRQCDYDLWGIWLRFVEEESILRDLSREVSDHFCVEGANGTMEIFRDTSVILFPPWLEQKPVVVRWEVDYGVKVPVCERLFEVLDDKTAECDAHQTSLESAACAHGRIVQDVRETFASSWDYAVTTYQRVVDEVHCLEIDRWKEWRTLATVQCLLNRTTERNGRACDETTDEVHTEIAHCEDIQWLESVDHLIIIYQTIPEFPPFCPTPPWEMAITVHPFPGRCVPVPPHVPCSSGFFTQEYAELWTPPQPEFYAGTNFEEGNSHCNQRPECATCPTEPESPICGVIFSGHWFFVYPSPEHECHDFTQAHVDSWSAPTPGDSLAPVQLPPPLSDLQRSRDRTTPAYVANMLTWIDQDYSDLFCAQSTDDCGTIDGYPGANTHSELRLDQVVAILAGVPEREVSGQIRRLGDLGYFIFNDLVWEDDWKVFPIGADLEDHRNGRTIADSVMGHDSRAWSTGMIRARAQEFFAGRNSFTEADLTNFNNILLHKILLDLDLTDDEAAFFEQYKSQSFLISLLPKDWVLCIEPHYPQVEGLKAMRNQLLDMYEEALDRDTRTIIPRIVDGHDKRFLADLFLTAMTSAGGLSVPTVMGMAFAVLHGAEAHGSVVLPGWQDFELTNNNIEQFALEVIRRFPVVVGFPMWDPENQESRTVLNLAMALRDPRAWEDPKEFRLRPLSEYHETRGTGTKIGVAWAQQAKGNHGLTPDSRGCPGQDLSVVIISEVLRAYMSSQHEWSLAGVDGTLQITEGPSGAKDYTVVRNGASAAAAAASPLSAASQFANMDPADVAEMLGEILTCMPERWHALVPPELIAMMAGMPAELTGQAIPPEVVAMVGAIGQLR